MAARTGSTSSDASWPRRRAISRRAAGSYARSAAAASFWKTTIPSSNSSGSIPPKAQARCSGSPVNSFRVSVHEFLSFNSRLSLALTIGHHQGAGIGGTTRHRDEGEDRQHIGQHQEELIGNESACNLLQSELKCIE